MKPANLSLASFPGLVCDLRFKRLQMAACIQCVSESDADGTIAVGTMRVARSVRHTVAPRWLVARPPSRRTRSLARQLAHALSPVAQAVRAVRAQIPSIGEEDH